MSENTLIWLFGGMAAWNLSITIAGIKLWILTTQLKTMWILTSKKAAEILHSPDNHHGLDELLDLYISGEYKLTYEQWEELKLRCEELIANPNGNKNEQVCAAFLVAVATPQLQNKWSKL